MPRQYSVTVGKDDISWKGIGYGPWPPAAPIVIIVVIISVLSDLLCANWGVALSVITEALLTLALL